MGDMWKELGKELAGLVLPGGCSGCGLPGVRGELCEHCGRTLGGSVPCRVPLPGSPEGAPVVYGALPYADEVRAVLLAHKERGALGLAAPLGAVLATVVAAALRELRPAAGEGGPLALVPVPSAKRSVAGRGHDPVRRIALAAAGRLRREGIPARVLAVLRQRRLVDDQSRLTARRRSSNLRGALAAAPGTGDLLGARVSGAALLVDDLVTTGASLTEAARAVRAAGGQVTGAAVVAVAR